MIGFTGIAVFGLAAWIISENRTKFPFKLAITGVILQFAIGALLLYIPFFKDFFLYLNSLVLALEESCTAGTTMLFGYLGGGTLPFAEKFPGGSYILAFRGLPLVLFMGAISSLLFHWGILQKIIHGFSWFLGKTLKLGGPEGMGVSANIFVGMVEAPLFIRPYLDKMTRSELFTIMSCGMATISGTVMVLYASILKDTIPGIMGHILMASVISVPAVITISKIMIPEMETPTTGRETSIAKSDSAMDAIANGTLQGVSLLLNIIAMMIVLVAMVHLVNMGLSILPSINGAPLTLQKILGFILSPVVWLMGVPWSESQAAGALLGTKTILNEFIAYLNLAALPPEALTDKSRIIMVYALCGFANPGSLGIMIGGLGALSNERKSEIASLGFKSIIAGTIATCMTGAVVGILY